MRSHRALAGILFSSPAESLAELAAHAGVGEKTLQTIARTPHAVAWIVGECAKTAKLGLAAVYAKMLRESLASRRPDWCKLFLERFDPDYKPAGRDSGGTNIQVNNFGSYTTEELRAFVASKARKVLG